MSNSDEVSVTFRPALNSLELEILRKLEMLCEGNSSDLDRPNLHRVHPNSTEPPGVNTNRLDARNPPLDPLVSLYAFHKARLIAAKDKVPYSPAIRLKALAEATHDYETSKRRPPSYLDRDHDVNTEDRDDAIVRWEGKRPEWVGVFEHCSSSYVEKLRRRLQRFTACGHKMADPDPECLDCVKALRAARNKAA